jgi:hypothetical protein
VPVHDVDVRLLADPALQSSALARAPPVKLANSAIAPKMQIVLVFISTSWIAVSRAGSGRPLIGGQRGTHEV